MMRTNGIHLGYTQYNALAVYSRFRVFCYNAENLGYMMDMMGGIRIAFP